ncbi:flavodoxin [uncultured Treponema sp.]|uniref:flavodoxin n=1 Tax=uncultured Treponema sp. TaxID=162155 RepID=UPI0025F02DE1|nr:flavodoxin [uncultured Treponema sp.]
MKKSIFLILGAFIMFGANAQSSQGAQNAKKTVICYFSATGTTERLAKTAAQALGADLHEIVPVQKYSSADLNWRDNNSRCVRENNNEKSRPAIANSIDLSGYDNVIVAYPIWWGLAPKIVYTFVEQNDLSGKNLVTLCTSGGSGLGRSGSDLAKHANGAAFKGGREFRGSASGAEVKKYIDGILK